MGIYLTDLDGGRVFATARELGPAPNGDNDLPPDPSRWLGFLFFQPKCDTILLKRTHFSLRSKMNNKSRIVNRTTPAALCSQRLDGKRVTVATTLPERVTQLLLHALDDERIEVDPGWSATIGGKSYFIATINEKAFTELVNETEVNSATRDEWIAGARNALGDLTLLFEPPHLTQPKLTGLAVWHREDKFWLDPEDIAVNGNGQLLLRHQPYPYDGPEYAVHRDVGLTADGGQRLLEGHIVQWGHRKGFEESRPRQAVVIIHPTEGVGFNTFNLGVSDHFFSVGSFAYSELLDDAMEILGHVRDGNADYPIEHAAFRYFDVPPEDYFAPNSKSSYSPSTV